MKSSVFLVILVGIVFGSEACAQDYWAAGNNPVVIKGMLPTTVESTATSKIFIDLSLKPNERQPDSVFQIQANNKTPPSARSPKIVNWCSDDMGHKRLLFEEKCLERQGIALPPATQTIESSFKFFARGTLLPLSLIQGKHRNCYGQRDR